VAHEMAGWRAVVTGAGSGIGRAFALELAARGVDLVLCDVAVDRLEPVALACRAAGVRVEPVALDVRDFAAFDALAERLCAEGPVQLLINNAGVATAGRILDTPIDDWRWVVDVNLFGVVHGCKAFIPRMVTAGARAHVINLASASAFLGSPGIGAYSVTKHGVLALSQVLDAELQGSPVRVHVLCPGFVRTRILDDARVAAPDPEGSRARATRLFVDGRAPEHVARAALRAVATGRFLVPVFAEAHALHLARALPEWAHRAARWGLARRMARIGGGAP
jgi:short-subunit dehydrogenase